LQYVPADEREFHAVISKPAQDRAVSSDECPPPALVTGGRHAVLVQSKLENAS